MLHFTKISNLQKCVFLFAMMLLPMTMCSCGNSSRKKSQNQETEDQEQTSRQKYRFKVTTSTKTDESPWNFNVNPNQFDRNKIYKSINIVVYTRSFKVHVVDANDKPVIFDPEGDYTDLVVPRHCISWFIRYARTLGEQRSGIKQYYYKNANSYDYDDGDGWYNQPEDGMEELNIQTQLLEKYINYIWELPLTNQPIDDIEIKEDFNRYYYDLDLKNYSIIEIKRSYDEIVYGFLGNDKVLYNPEDLERVCIERLPDNTIGYTVEWMAKCYNGDEYPGELQSVREAGETVYL